VPREQAECVLDRGLDRLADHGDDLVDGPRAVEERQQGGEQPGRRRAAEANRRAAVLEQQPVGCLEQAIPRLEQGQLWDRCVAVHTRSHGLGEDATAATATADRVREIGRACALRDRRQLEQLFGQ
jgi:hypothetical protein